MYFMLLSADAVVS